MRDIREITDTLNSIYQQAKMAEYHKMTKREHNKLAKQAAFLSLCKKYLESDPKQEFLLKEIDRLENRLDRINEAYQQWHDQQVLLPNNPKNHYDKFMGVPDIKKQVNALRYLIG